MTRVLTFMALLICALLCSICGADETATATEAQDETADWKERVNPRLHYSIKWPRGWDEDRTRVGLYGMQRLVKMDPEGAQVQVLHMPTGLLSAEKLAKVVAAMAKANPATKERLSEEALELDGRAGLAATYNGQQEGRAVKTLAHFISTESGLFVLLGIMPAEQAMISPTQGWRLSPSTADWDEMTQIVRSFRYDPALQETDKPPPADPVPQPPTGTTPPVATPPAAGAAPPYTISIPEGWDTEEPGAEAGPVKRFTKAGAEAVIVEIGHAWVPQMSLQELEQFAALNSIGNPLLRQKMYSSSVVFAAGPGLVAAFTGSDGTQECRSLVKYVSTASGLFVMAGRAPADVSADDWKEVVAIVGSFHPGIRRMPEGEPSPED